MFSKILWILVIWFGIRYVARVLAPTIRLMLARVLTRTIESQMRQQAEAHERNANRSAYGETHHYGNARVTEDQTRARQNNRQPRLEDVAEDVEFTEIK